MHRREFIATTAWGGTLLGGCIGRPGTAAPPRRDRIAGHEFALAWSENWDLPGPPVSHAADVVVESTTAPPRLLVVGQVASGSRSCRETVLHELDCDGETLAVSVADNFVADRDAACTSELAVVPYELRVTFVDELPDRLAVTHLDDGHDPEFRDEMPVR